MSVPPPRRSATLLLMQPGLSEGLARRKPSARCRRSGRWSRRSQPRIATSQCCSLRRRHHLIARCRCSASARTERGTATLVPAASPPGAGGWLRPSASSPGAQQLGSASRAWPKPQVVADGEPACRPRPELRRRSLQARSAGVRRGCGAWSGVQLRRLKERLTPPPPSGGAAVTPWRRPRRRPRPGRFRRKRRRPQRQKQRLNP